MITTAHVLHTFLFLTDFSFVFPFLTILFYTTSQSRIRRILTIFLFSLLINEALKYYFSVPLPPHLGPGWAFPSGHMQAACTLWISLALEARHRWVMLTSAVILLGIGTGLVYFDYHSIQDVFAGALFAILGLAVFYHCSHRYLLKDQFLGYLLGSIGLVIIAVVPLQFLHLWLATGSLFGLSLGTQRHQFPPSHARVWQITGALLLSLTLSAFCLASLDFLALDPRFDQWLLGLLLTLIVTTLTPWLIQFGTRKAERKH